VVPVGYRFDSGSGDEMEFHSNGDDRGGTCWGIVPIVARFGEQGSSPMMCTECPPPDLVMSTHSVRYVFDYFTFSSLEESM
jgi:hypothetical protein